MDERRILFLDFHGTLGTRRGGWSSIIAEVLEAHDSRLVVNAEQVHPLLHNTFPWDTPELPHPLLVTADAWWGALGVKWQPVFAALGVPADDHAALLATFRAQYLDPSYWYLYDDTLPALHQLSQDGWQLLIVSNHVPELPAIVDYLGLSPYLSAVLTSGLVPYEKPHPGLFEQALALVGGRQPGDQIWMVGDNPVADIQGAQGVGLPAVLVRNTHPSAPHVLADLAELSDFLDAQRLLGDA